MPRNKLIIFRTLQVQAYGRFPVGEPVVQLGDEILPLGTLFGFLSCDILPPRKMFLPPLASVVNGKLMTVLCNKCATEQLTASCPHTAEEKMLTGTWTTPELELAVAQGYRIVHTYEAWHFPRSSQYKKPTIPGDNAEQGLFTEFILNFLLLKTQASGPPRPNMTQEELQEYCDVFSEAYGLVLDPALLVFNPVLRAVSKLILNSIWVSNFIFFNVIAK
jgi:hypothetical protein